MLKLEAMGSDTASRPCPGCKQVGFSAFDGSNEEAEEEEEEGEEKLLLSSTSASACASACASVCVCGGCDFVCSAE